MADPNRQSFEGRIGRIEQVHRKGGGFEAAGALGMADFRPVPRRRRIRASVLPFLFVILVVVGLKTAMLSTIGAEAYTNRLADLAETGPLGEAAAMVLQPDPVTVALSARVDETLR